MRRHYSFSTHARNCWASLSRHFDCTCGFRERQQERDDSALQQLIERFADLPKAKEKPGER